MIDRIKLMSGSSPGQPSLEFQLTPLTVFVGPNNSGKSKVLMEIEKYSRTTQKHPTSVLVESVKFIGMDEGSIQDYISTLSLPPLAEDTIYEGFTYLGKLSPQNNSLTRVHIHQESLIREAQNPSDSSQNLAKLLDIYTLRLDGTNRLNLLAEQPAGDLLTASLNHLSHLFIQDEARKNVRRIVHEALGKYFVIDPTNVGHLRVRLSASPPNDEKEEKGWDEASLQFHKKAQLISDASDGVKAFVGIITTLIAGDPQITLIDEPEAFLHPGLAYILGKEIGISLINSSKRYFASTHSSAFLMGCIQSGIPLNIVRLTYQSGVATSRLLPQEKILHLMRHPLLRSTGVLNGLFYEAVVVTEADSDRAFYQEINERLLAVNDPRGIRNCLFLNAQNKQTVWDIVKPLRELGIPAAGIVDLDVVKEGGQVFSKLLEGAYIPALNHQPFTGQRKIILDALDATGNHWKTNGGVSRLTNGDMEASLNYFRQLDEYGAFVVRNGELESWLMGLGALHHGSTWLIDVFTRMGENPNSIDYVRPQDGDVWAFLGSIKQWIDNSNRQGIPT